MKANSQPDDQADVKALQVSTNRTTCPLGLSHNCRYSRLKSFSPGIAWSIPLRLSRRTGGHLARKARFFACPTSNAEDWKLLPESGKRFTSKRRAKPSDQKWGQS